MLIIHGDNQIASRHYFLDLKHQNSVAGKQIIDIPGQSLTLQELKNKWESSSLLGENNSLFIENFFFCRPSREKNLITDYLLSHPREDIFLWEPQDISLHLKKFPQELIKKFDLPKLIFEFLDHPSILHYHQLLANSVPEQIFSLLVNHFRKLLLVKYHTANIPPWQMQKLNLQASNYSHSHLKDLYSKLLEIDYQQKTSSTSNNLSFALELWLSRL